MLCLSVEFILQKYKILQKAFQLQHTIIICYITLIKVQCNPVLFEILSIVVVLAALFTISNISFKFLLKISNFKA